MSARAGLQPRAQGAVRVLAKPLEIVFKRFFEGVLGTLTPCPGSAGPHRIRSTDTIAPEAFPDPGHVDVRVGERGFAQTDVRTRGYGAWRFDDAHTALHDRVAGILASLEPTPAVARQLTNLITMVTLRSITRTLEKDLLDTEFVVLPIFGRTGQSEYQIEIHVSRPDALTLDELNTVLANAQNELTPGESTH